MFSDVEILARTLYGEARGEYGKVNGGISSLIAVGNVVINRLNKKTWYGKTVKEVCQKPWQFSCWNSNDPNFKIINSDIILDLIFDICLTISDKLIKGEWPDLTKGSDSYYATYLKEKPKWVVGLNPKFQIGNHIFYEVYSKKCIPQKNL